MLIARSQDDVELILNRVIGISGDRIARNELIYKDPVSNENFLFEIIKEACLVEGFAEETVELVSGHKFPDVVFREARIGVEIKGHQKGDRILGNSIMGTTPSILQPVAIYLLAWNNGEKKVVWRNYFDCVIGAEVTHSPRFILRADCSVEESLFGDGDDQIGNVEEICLGPEGIKSEVILARMRSKALAKGNAPWWISNSPNELIDHPDDRVRQLAIIKYSKLKQDSERSAFLKTLLIGFPEILGSSQNKFAGALVWGLVRKSVLITRDAFTAGGRMLVDIPDICDASPVNLPQVLVKCAQLFESPNVVRLADIQEIWNVDIPSVSVLKTELENKIFAARVGEHASQVLHDDCRCSEISADDFQVRITNWLIDHLDLKTIQ